MGVDRVPPLDLLGRHYPPLADRLRTARPLAQLRAGRRDWYTIKTAASTDGGQPTAEIAIYDEIGYWGVTAADFVTELKALDAAAIDVRINSPGGEVWDGLAIYNALRDHAATITTRVDGLAASAASVILQAGDRRLAAKASQVMIHDGWGLVVGGAEDMRAMADQLDKVNDILAQVYADRAGGNVEDWRAAMRAETWYTGAEAATAGLVDQTGDSTDDDSKDDGGEQASAHWDLSIFSYAGRLAAPAPVLPAASKPTALAWDPAEFKQAVRRGLRR